MNKLSWLLLSGSINLIVGFTTPVTPETVMIPMRDGVQLSTDIYRPNDDISHPVVLYRTPYNKKTDGIPPSFIALLNMMGYAYVTQDCRGRFASQGIDSVFITDGWGTLQDGYDTIEWIVAQNWCNGKIGMIGGSATGITTLRAVGSLHPNLACAVAAVAPTDFYRQVVYPGGEFRKAICENWIHGQGSDYMIPYFLAQPYYNSIWELMNWHTRTAMITTPILYIGGWYDCFSDGTIAAFTDMYAQTMSGPQKLVMGPWTHGTLGSDDRIGQLRYPASGVDYTSLIFTWVDYWLRNIENGVLEQAAVRYYLLGDPQMVDEIGCEWLEADNWPPENVGQWELFLTADGKLQGETTGEGEVSFSYDPNEPVPTMGGNNLTIDAGPYDQRTLNQRPDVIQFVSNVFSAPVRVEGFIHGRVFVSSNCPDTDITLKLIDVYPDGREMLVVDGIQRLRFRNGYHQDKISFLNSGEVVPVELNLPPTAIVFNSGHQIKVCISSSNFPRYEVNPNTANAPNDRTNPQVAVNTIHFGGDTPSKIILPVVGAATPVLDNTGKISTFALLRNYPNPFNDDTIIQFTLRTSQFLELSVYNVWGQRIKILKKDLFAAGTHGVHWNAMDDVGRLVASGVYVCRLQAQDFTVSEKMILIH